MMFLCWYVICGGLAYAGADLLTWGPLPAMVAGAVLLAVAAAVAAWIIASHLLWRRDGMPQLRRRLAGLAAKRAGDDATWVNVDEGVTFRVGSLGRWPLCFCTLIRSDASQAWDIRDAGPRAVTAVTGEAFTVVPGVPGVRRRMIGARVTPAGDGLKDAGLVAAALPAPAVEALHGRLRGLLAGHQAARVTQAGVADELREAIRQFEASGPLT
jgi:hypothetical protein